MAYEFPTNISNMTGYSQYFNTITDGYFWTLTLLGFAMCLYLYLAARSEDTSMTLHATLFLSFLVALPLFAMRLITSHIMLLMLLLWAFSAIFYKTQQ